MHGSLVWNEMYQSALELSEPFDIVKICRGDVFDRLPEPITLQTRQNSIGKSHYFLRMLKTNVRSTMNDDSY